MFFVSSGSIVGDYPEMREVIERLDAHLAAVGDGAVRADTAADFVGADPAEIERLLKEYLLQGLLTSQAVYLCPQCDQVLGLIRDGHELWCDLCERTQSLRGKDLRGSVIYRVRADALREPAQEEAAGPGSALPGTPILFIAGDRGGGPRVQLDLPGEEKALRQAVKNATLAARFVFLPPLYAATAGQLVEQVEAGPGILHFVGHGADRRLQLVDPAQPLGVQPVTPERLADLLRHAPNTIHLAYFNTCDSDGTARFLAEARVVEAAIGWPGKINDIIAVQYAETFYRLACGGRPLSQAMQMASVCLGTSAIQPQLFVAGGIDPNTHALIRGIECHPASR
jgi:hypothetical protein